MPPVPKPAQASSQDPVAPIPPFYCVYLLRSTVRHASLYIGSTPDPARRISQHNGRIKGGAKKTHKDTLRPWEMAAIVSGFTSRTAALQFEWAWQNTRNSRHAAIDSQSSNPNIKICPRTGKKSNSSARPRLSMTSVMISLHLLLRSEYFSCWPLELRFFSIDAHRVWLGCCQHSEDLLPDSIGIVLDLPNEQTTNSSPFDRLDTKNAKLKTYFSKSEFVIDEDEVISCKICNQQLDTLNDLITICSHDQCSGVSHLTCLSSNLLEKSPSKIIPDSGRCPTCSSLIEWPILMKEMTLRVRGPGAKKTVKQNTEPPKNSKNDESQFFVVSSGEESCGESANIDKGHGCPTKMEPKLHSNLIDLPFHHKTVLPIDNIRGHYQQRPECSSIH
ncbi:Slx4p interacting protein [Ophidiomyces ophidiicola]|nr:Slx4p interacting protein [Ophidiomyces ophidiicola]KAI1995839.1 Slx4p interacting protein [Ophidiomyces ophidiicola]KAI1998248.1 Slx4p interacting protein [Ophidiomyces ophidiicola]KAI2000815.1 Slx4p interacting protein [Ophidiomyces ophidiicola]